MSNKGFPLTEFVLETVIRDGFGELRSNTARVDYLLGRFLEAQFLNQYGQTKINQIKNYLTGNQVKIVHAYNLQPTVMPCVSIQMVASEERSEDQQLGNYYPEQFSPKNRDVIIASVTPLTYDPVTGKLTIHDSVDLSTVCPNLIFKDADGAEFVIRSGISNLLGAKFINIGPGQTPDISAPGQILDPIDFTGMERGMIRLREVVRIGIHAKDDIHLTKYLYYVIFYILKSRQRSLITRGVHLDQGIVGVFDRLEEFEGENVYSRYFDLHCLTEFNYTIDELAAASCFEVTVKPE